MPYVAVTRRGAMKGQQDATATWNLFRLNWLLIAAMSNVLALGVWLTEFDLAPHGYLIAFSIGATYGVLGYFNAMSPRRGSPLVAFSLTAVAQLVLVVAGNRPARAPAILAQVLPSPEQPVFPHRPAGDWFRSFFLF